MRRVIFINYYNKGDIHVSRGFVSSIINKLKSLYPDIKFAYSHKHSPDLISDISELEYDSDGLLKVHNFCTSLNQNPQYTNIVKIDDDIYLSTWYAQQDKKYLEEYGITFDTLYLAFDEICKTTWNFSLSDISENLIDFYPKINFEKYEIENCKAWIDSHPGKKIFIANGPSLSGQSYNFDFSKIIKDIATQHSDKYFLLTNVENKKINLPNIIYTEDIIKNKLNNDLNENAYISKFCDVIIGRGSGASSFAFNVDNIMNKDIKFIYFCNFVDPEINKFWVGKLFKNSINYNAEFIISDTGHEPTVKDIIIKNI
jgi:hypothetical protein